MFVTILFDKSFLGSPFSDQVGVFFWNDSEESTTQMVQMVHFWIDFLFTDSTFSSTIRTNDMALPPEKQAIEQGEERTYFPLIDIT